MPAVFSLNFIFSARVTVSFFAEKVWFLSARRLWTGTGEILDLVTEQGSHQRRVSLPTIYRKMSTIKIKTRWSRFNLHYPQ